MNTSNTAIILAGGKSLRMGFDKKLICLDNRPLIEILIDKLTAIFENIIIVSNDAALGQKLGVKIVEDEIKDIGPLGGIHAGLKNSNSHYNYFIACDMPYVNEKYIHFIKNKSSKTNAYALITRYKDHIEPFNSFYSKKLTREIENHIKNGERSIYSLLRKLEVLYIEEKIARRYSPDWAMFYNINTIEDLNRILT
ncbi:molybdenum cofactor guanylyltransferase [Clostridiaceae bacterium 35-E11]